MVLIEYVQFENDYTKLDYSISYFRTEPSYPIVFNRDFPHVRTHPLNSRTKWFGPIS